MATGTDARFWSLRRIVTIAAVLVLVLVLFSEVAQLRYWPTNHYRVSLAYSDIMISRYDAAALEARPWFKDDGRKFMLQGAPSYTFLPRGEFYLSRGQKGGLIIPLGWLASVLLAWSAYLHGRVVGARRANPDGCRRCGYPLAPAAAAALADAGAIGDPAAPQEPAARTCPECGTRNPPARQPRGAAS